MAEFVPMDIGKARDFIKQNHWGVLATRRKNGQLQMSPVTVALDDQGQVIISSRETAYKVNNLRRDPRAAVCVFTEHFHGHGWVQVNGTAEIISLPHALVTLVHLQRQVYGEHKSWPEYHERMVREKRVIIRVTIESIDEKTTIKACLSFVRNYHLLVGGSTGTVLAAVQQLASLFKPDDTIVAISADLGEKYLDTIYDSAWVKESLTEPDDKARA